MFCRAQGTTDLPALRHIIHYRGGEVAGKGSIGTVISLLLIAARNFFLSLLEKGCQCLKVDVLEYVISWQSNLLFGCRSQHCRNRHHCRQQCPDAGRYQFRRGDCCPQQIGYYLLRTMVKPISFKTAEVTPAPSQNRIYAIFQ